MQFFKNYSFKIINWAKRITFPGFDKMPIYNVAVFFFKGLYDGSITTRAAAVAFSFFIAIFPTMIFFFTLIPYIPIENFQIELLKIIEELLPNNAFLIIQETLEDIVLNQRGNLLSFSFLVAIIFSTNGITAMIDAFNASIYVHEIRSWINQRIIAIVLVIILSLLIILAVSLLVFSRHAVNYLADHGVQLIDLYFYYILTALKWIIIIGLFFFTISFLYYLAPAKKTRWRFISAGSTLTTILIFLTSWGFSYYINNFGQYNKLYGSIGTLLVTLLWLYFNALALITGFELNASLIESRKKKEWIAEKETND